MNRYIAMILGAGSLWGLLGLFTRVMSAFGFSPFGMVLIRCGIAAVLFGITLLIRDKSLFRIRLRHLWCFLGAGICSLLFFMYCYIRAISLTSLSTAAILLYTAPSMVMIMSLFIFHEKLTKAKILALVMAFLGCCFVSGLGTGSLAVTWAGLIFGLCSGFGYALYSIFARLAMNRGYASLTINFYSCLFAALGAALIWNPMETLRLYVSGWQPLAVGFLMAFVGCYLPYLLYTTGLEKVETGRASVMASVEPVVATISGVLAFHEKLTALSLLGICLVLGAVVVLNLKIRIRME